MLRFQVPGVVGLPVFCGSFRCGDKVVASVLNVLFFAPTMETAEDGRLVFSLKTWACPLSWGLDILL